MWGKKSVSLRAIHKYINATDSAVHSRDIAKMCFQQRRACMWLARLTFLYKVWYAQNTKNRRGRLKEKWRRFTRLDICGHMDRDSWPHRSNPSHGMWENGDCLVRCEQGAALPVVFHSSYPRDVREQSTGFIVSALSCCSEWVMRQTVYL